MEAADDRTAPLRAAIRAIPDHPKPGITFRDVTPLLGDAQAFGASIDLLAEAAAPFRADTIAGIEARGFVFGAALAARAGTGFVPVRKPGKLPAKTLSRAYALEYGEDRLEIHADAVAPGERVLIVDDLLATGGTAAAAAGLLAEAGAEVAGLAFLIELDGLPGREVLEAAGHRVVSLMRFA